MRQPNQSYMAASAGAGALMEKPLNVPFLLQTITELLAEPPETRIARLAGRQDYLRLSRAGSEESAKQMRPKSHHG